MLAMVALSLALAEVMLILVSWLLTAAVPEASMRSLLSSEGIRWFFGHFSDNLATPVLVWLLLVSSSPLFKIIPSQPASKTSTHSFSFRISPVKIKTLTFG